MERLEGGNLRCVCCGKEKEGETIQLVVQESVVRDKRGNVTGRKYKDSEPALAVLCDACMEQYYAPAMQKLKKPRVRGRFVCVAILLVAVCLYAASLRLNKSILLYFTFAAVPTAWIAWKIYRRAREHPEKAAAAFNRKKEKLRAELCERYLSLHTPKCWMLAFHRILPEDSHKKLRGKRTRLSAKVREEIVSYAQDYYSREGKRTSMQPYPVEEVVEKRRSCETPYPYPDDPRIYVW